MVGAAWTAGGPRGRRGGRGCGLAGTRPPWCSAFSFSVSHKTEPPTPGHQVPGCEPGADPDGRVLASSLGARCPTPPLPLVAPRTR